MARRISGGGRLPLPNGKAVGKIQTRIETTMINSRTLFRTAACIAALLLAAGMAAPAMAAPQKLSDLALAGYHRDGSAVILDTTGAAKVRLSFLGEGMARIEISPSGVLTANPSPAVAGSIPAPGDVQVSDAGDTLRIKTAGLSLHIAKAHLAIDAYDGDDQQPLSQESPADSTTWDSDTGALSQTRMLSDDEHIYGLGQDNANRGTLDRRGTIRDMWTGQQIRSGNVTANYPIPFYLSTGPSGHGYGVFVDNVWHMRLDVGKTRKDQLTWTAPGGPIDYYIINGPSFKTVIDRYTHLTGRPAMLPLYAFGYWQSRCFFQNFADIQTTVDRFKADHLPLDVLVIDSNWPKVEVDFKWSDAFLSGKPAEDWIQGLHAGGAHVMLSTKGPMIRSDSENFAEAKRLGLFASDGQGHTLMTGYYGGELMDFTHPGMEPWLATQLAPLSKQGIDAWWLDLNEPEGEPPQAVYNRGKSADIHNTFPLLTFKAYFDYQRALDPTDRPVVLGRAASAGTQRYSGIVWTGDIASDWPTFQAHIPEAQNTGLSGLPYWTNDSGGFLSGFLDNDRYGAHAELYTRWFEFTTFAPIMRAHKAGPAEPYEYGQDGEDTARHYMQLRYRLLPYIYTTAHETATTGLPMLRPLVLEFQDDPASATAETEFMFGHDLLVAPVIVAHATSRQVYFPPGDWISYDDGFQVTGGQSIGVAAPLNRIPLFVRAGAILATAPDMMSSGEKPWDPITLDIWPQGTSTASLYQDDNLTTAYETGKSTTTRFDSVAGNNRSLDFTITPSNALFGPKQWLARFHLTATPTRVTLDGKPLTGWTFDTATTTLTVAVPGERRTHRLEIALDGVARPRAEAPKIDNAPDMTDMTEILAARQIPQFLPAPILPRRIEAANYDKGGEALAFNVATPAADTPYRQDGVPLVTSDDQGGGYAIHGLQAGDWLAYTIDAGDGGWFNLSARVRSATGGQLSVVRSRVLPLTTVAVAASSPWTSVAGQSAFYLPPGLQIVTVRAETPGIDLGNFTFAKRPEAVVTVEAETGVMTGVGLATDHPGLGGAGFVAGIGGKQTSVAIPLTVPADGRYLVVLRYANGQGDARAMVTPLGAVGVPLALPPTGAWDDYGETGVVLDLKAGARTITIAGTDVGVVNIDQLKLMDGQ